MTDELVPKTWGRVARLAMKELRETLRDRRTILTLLLMPVLLYPLLSLTFQKFLITQSREQRPYRIGVDRDHHVSLVKQLLLNGQRVLTAEGQSSLTKVSYDVEYISDPQSAVLHDTIDVGVSVVNEARPGIRLKSEGEAIDFELIVYDAARPHPAEVWLIDRLRAAGIDMLVNRMTDLRVKQRDVPVRIVRRAVRSRDGEPLSPLSPIIPVVLVLMTITGAVYPAIDLTAGERERNTLELLMAAPVPRLGLLFAKYVAVVTVAMLTAGLNLASMTVTLQVSGLGSEVWPKGLSIRMLIEVFLLLALFAGFFSAVLLCITSFARSFKEAQAYLIPVMLVAISPALLVVLPGTHLGGWLAVTPMINVNLLARDIIAHQAHPGAALVVVATTVLYGAAALGLASRIFGADAVLYDARAGWTELFVRPGAPRDAAPLSTALLCVAMLFPATFLAAGGVAQLAGTDSVPRLLLNSVASAFLFVGVPVALAGLQRVDWQTGFRLHGFSPLAAAGAGLLGMSLWPFAHEMVILMNQLGLATLSPELIKKAQEIIGKLREVPLIVVLGALAVIPAVTEEILFRGYAFSALLRRLSPPAAIVLSGLLFGMFHLVATDVLAVERLLPSSCLGMVLAWICWKSGSVLPGILLHTVHNGLLLLVVYYEPLLKVQSWFPAGLTDPDAAQHLPLAWLAIASLTAAAGASFVWLGQKPPDASINL